MSGYTVFAIAVVLLAAAGFAMKRNGELEGLGQVRGRGALRAPHGALVRTKRLDAFEDAAFSSKLLRVGGACLAVTAVVALMCLLGVFELSEGAATIVDVVAVMAVSVGLAQGNGGFARSTGYVLAGGFSGMVALSAIPYALSFWLGEPATALVNGLTMAGATVGSACAAACQPLVRTYAREFADGHVSVVKVSARSVAARAFDELADDAWEPPAERIGDDDVRKAMERRAR